MNVQCDAYFTIEAHVPQLQSVKQPNHDIPNNNIFTVNKRDEKVQISESCLIQY